MLCNSQYKAFITFTLHEETPLFPVPLTIHAGRSGYHDSVRLTFSGYYDNINPGFISVVWKDSLFLFLFFNQNKDLVSVDNTYMYICYHGRCLESTYFWFWWQGMDHVTKVVDWEDSLILVLLAEQKPGFHGSVWKCTISFLYPVTGVSHFIFW